MSVRRFDAALLAALRGAGDWLTTERVAARCEDPFAAARAADWLVEAQAAGLVIVRRRSDGPLEWRLSPRGRRRAERA